MNTIMVDAYTHIQEKEKFVLPPNWEAGKEAMSARQI
jgi:alkyl hydroperoxide reductase subunit AhpC